MQSRRVRCTKIRWDFDNIFSRPPPQDAAAAAAATGDEADAAATADANVADAAAADAATGGDAVMAVRGAVAGGAGGSAAGVTLDIGFGLGESLLGMAAARPHDFFVGIEASESL